VHDHITVVAIAIAIASKSMKAPIFTRIQGNLKTVAGISRGFRLCSKIGANSSDKKMKIPIDFFNEVLSFIAGTWFV